MDNVGEVLGVILLVAVTLGIIAWLLFVHYKLTMLHQNCDERMTSLESKFDTLLGALASAIPNASV